MHEVKIPLTNTDKITITMPSRFDCVGSEVEYVYHSDINVVPGKVVVSLKGIDIHLDLAPNNVEDLVQILDDPKLLAEIQRRTGN